MAGIDSTRASLRIFGDDLEPGEITTLLGREPTTAWRKGEPRKPNSPIAARSGRWSLESVRRQPGDLDSQIKEIFAGLTNDLDIWSRIRARYRIDMFCGLFMEEWNEGVNLSPEAMRLLADRSIPLGLDIYGPDNGELQSP